MSYNFENAGMSGRKYFIGGNCNIKDRAVVFLAENVLCFGRRLIFLGENMIFLDGSVVCWVEM